MDESQEYLEMMQETGRLAAQFKARFLQDSANTYSTESRNRQLQRKASNAGSGLAAFQQSAGLVNDVEFWRWMGENYPRNLGNPQLIQQTAAANGDWLRLQLQGKGYEWDFMTAQRTNPAKLLSQFSAGTNPTQPGIDITETGILDSAVKGTYQNKAYLGTASPNLRSTPQDAVVVTNQEQAASAARKGYETQGFMDAGSIRSKRDTRLQAARSGQAAGSYTLNNITSVSAKAGILGAFIGITSETILSYRSWKNGDITDEEYLRQVLSAGGEAGVTSGLTAAAMVPVQAAVTVAGASTLLAFPVAFVFGSAVNAIVAPCFGRGKYRQILNEAKYYQALEDVYDDFIRSAETSAEQYTHYMQTMLDQVEQHETLKQKSSQIKKSLKSLYDSI